MAEGGGCFVLQNKNNSIYQSKWHQEQYPRDAHMGSKRRKMSYVYKFTGKFDRVKTERVKCPDVLSSRDKFDLNYL